LKITSRDNQRLKNARKTRDGKIKDAIFVEGVRLVEEFLRSNLTINEVFYSEEFAENDRGTTLLEIFLSQNIEVFEVSWQIFNSLSDTKNSQGIVLIAEKPRNGQEILELNLTNNRKIFPLVLLLHEINNPSNLGAILRTAEAAGVCGIILTNNSAKAFSPKALRASMGAAFRLPIWENADYSEVLYWAKQNNFTTVCADVNAKKSYLEIDWKKPRLLVFGSEANGLSFDERNQMDEGLIIPMENDVESLNLAVSCGIILFEAKRQTCN
jgi:TrmH family RNA methyltransferase